MGAAANAAPARAKQTIPPAPRRAVLARDRRNLGFPESAARAASSELRADAELTAASVEHLLREALCRISSTTC